MKPFENCDVSILKKISIIFSDIDDTITLNGKLPEESYRAMWNAHRSGIRIIPVTGRPAGWVDHIARMWPVFAVVGENGAFYDMMKNGKLIRCRSQKAEPAATSQSKLRAVWEEILRAVPEAALASDQNYREYDLAVDFCEDIPRLSESQINRIVSLFKQHGATVKVSSIHINGWFGDFSKLSMVKTLIKNELLSDFEPLLDSALFIGDSENDESMFKEFRYSVGVANIQNFMDRLTVTPTYITKKPGGIGFAEVINRVLDSKTKFH